jgi:hypothetical protein
MYSDYRENDYLASVKAAVDNTLAVNGMNPRDFRIRLDFSITHVDHNGKNAVVSGRIIDGWGWSMGYDDVTDSNEPGEMGRSCIDEFVQLIKAEEERK